MPSVIGRYILRFKFERSAPTRCVEKARRKLGYNGRDESCSGLNEAGSKQPRSGSHAAIEWPLRMGNHCSPASGGKGSRQTMRPRLRCILCGKLFVPKTPLAIARSFCYKHKISRQRVWQLKQQKLGRCVKCGKPTDFFRTWCNKHGLDHRIRDRAYARKRWGLHPWKRGSTGRQASDSIPSGKSADTR